MKLRPQVRLQLRLRPPRWWRCRAALLLTLASLLVAASTAAAAPAPPNSVVYPATPPRVVFSHGRHEALGLSCTFCHAAPSSTRAADRLLPEERICATCHAITREATPRALDRSPAASARVPSGRCATCHPGAEEPAEVSPADPRGGREVVPDPPDAAQPPSRPPSPPSPRPTSLPLPSSPPTPALKFSHQLHVTQGAACTSCHAPEALDGEGHLGLPSMASCLACHDGHKASARCAACHPSLADGRLRTDWPAGKLVPTGAWAGIGAHGPDFRERHGPAARDESRCQVCHLRSFCTDCHAEGVVRPGFLHPANYVDLHAMEARRNVPACSACHRTQSFCVGCHQRLGVAADPTGGEPGKRASNPFGTGSGLKSFHPPGWVAETSGMQSGAAPSGHAREARRNLTSCVSCHREESCLACHSTDPSRAAQVDPHGPGFAASARCRALAARNQRVCLKCHAAGAAELGCR